MMSRAHYIDDLSQSTWISGDAILGENTISVFLNILTKLLNLRIRGREGTCIGHFKFLPACLNN